MLLAHRFEEESAKEAGLHYISDQTPGIRRIAHGKSFTYQDHSGQVVRSPETLARIKALVIPPAWKDVWICPDARGHLQVTGRDVRGRKQYRYHTKWRETRDETKYGRMLHFGKVLPKIRSEVNRQLKQPGLSRQKVLAAVLRLLELSAIRVGNEEYVTQNHSYGLTTLRTEHARVTGNVVHLKFRGKSGKEHRIDINHPALAHIVKKCQHIPGQMLFQFVEGEKVHHITSGDVNDYLAQITGGSFTAKDFRTWTGTLLAAVSLCKSEDWKTKTKAHKAVVDTIKEVASHLGNTPAICRKCYVHPFVIECFNKGVLTDYLKTEQKLIRLLHKEEAALLALLRRCPPTH